jgi:hypothetical protein
VFARFAVPLERVEVVDHDLIWHRAFAAAVLVKADFEWNVQNPQLDIAVTRFDGALQDGAAVFSVDVRVVDDDVLPLGKRVFQPFVEQFERVGRRSRPRALCGWRPRSCRCSLYQSGVARASISRSRERRLEAPIASLRHPFFSGFGQRFECVRFCFASRFVEPICPEEAHAEAGAQEGDCEARPHFFLHGFW